MQWTILREAFHGHRTLVLIGDPKQAIYGFRGADVHAYLEARATGVGRAHPADQLAQRRAAARRAWPRSSAARRSATSGSGCCRSRPRTPAGWSTRAVPVQLRVRAARRPAGDQERHCRRPDPARDAVARDLADRVVVAALRRTHACSRATAATSGRCSPATSRCWCAQNSQAQLVQAQPARGRRTRRADRQDVACSPRRRPPEWQLLLEALEQPHRTTRVRRVALSCFVGLDAAAARRRAVTTSPTTSRCSCGSGARCSRTAGSRRCSRRCRSTSSCSRGSWARSAASGCSPTCGTSRR